MGRSGFPGVLLFCFAIKVLCLRAAPCYCDLLSTCAVPSPWDGAAIGICDHGVRFARLKMAIGIGRLTCKARSSQALLQSRRPRSVEFGHVMSRHVTSCHMSCHVNPCRVASCRVVSHRSTCHEGTV